MRCRWHPPGPYLEKLGGFAPEWVVLLRNRAMPEACFGGKIAILGGFAPEFLSGLFTQILGGHAPVRALTSNTWFSRNFIIPLRYKFENVAVRHNGAQETSESITDKI